MESLADSIWQRRGFSLIWDEKALAQITKTDEILSLREFISVSKKFPESLPSNGGNTMVVAGFDGSLDLLQPSEVNVWLESDLKPRILSFQANYFADAALIFWIPNGISRFEVETTDDAVKWICRPPHQKERIEVGRILWGKTDNYPQKIMLPEGNKFVGFFHARIT